MNTIEEIASVLKNLKSAIVFSHIRPDGDAVGCSLAIGRALSLVGVDVQVVNESDIPENFSYLDGTKRILKAPARDAEGYIAVDSSDESRFGALQEYFLKGKRKGKITVNIDHHISNTRFCKYNFVRDRASNCENVADVIKAMGVPLDKETATYLMAGIVTDSGGFSHNNVNELTFYAAAEAAKAGADVNAISYHLFKKQSKNRAALYAETISSIRYLLDDKLAVAYVSLEALERYHLKPDATMGIVDFALTIDEVEVSVCLMEVKEGQYKASLRSKGKVNVNGVAGTFGGGGHTLASGCMLFGDFYEVLDRLRFAVSRYLD